MKLCGLLLIASMLVSCGPGATAPEAAKSIVHAPPRNETLLLPAPGQKSVHVVADHLLGEGRLPGGTVADYEVDGKKYQLFVLRAESIQDAALYLLTVKNAMPDAKYVPHMGGYAGTHDSQHLFAFAKLQYLAGVIGLGDEEADPIARRLAVKLQ